jgi:hypothetical protein
VAEAQFVGSPNDFDIQKNNINGRNNYEN